MSDPADAAARPDAPPPPPRGPSVDLGVYGRRDEGGLAPSDIIAIALTALWLLAVAGFFLFTGADTPAAGGAGATAPLLTLLAVFLPVALIWVAATTARMLRAMRTETARLQAAVDAMRHAYVAQQQTGTTGGLRPEVERKIDELAAAQRKTEAALAVFVSRRDGDRVVASADGRTAMTLTEGGAGDTQPGLALGTPDEALRPPIDTATLIRALNFPETAEDREGFRAMRRALDDPGASRLVRAAQDVLTLLSEDGVYMDDLVPDRARPELWRRFAGGERGRAISGLGGVRDRSSLALAAARMKQDQIFRDAAHHFLRTFDRSFAAFEKAASDADIAAAADTRTARAFMLLGRVAGTFD